MKYGVISIVGKPNVGKSTLLNNIFKKPIVISSNKPQTTRNMIEVSLKNDDFLITFIDTPGLHKPKNKLDLFLNSEVKKSLKKSDYVLYLFDLSRSFDDEDEECLKVLKDFNVKNCILILNKKDLINEKTILEIKNNISSKFKFLNIFTLSAFDENDINQIMDFFRSNLSEYEGTTSELEFLEKEIDDKFFVSELIRECIIKNYRQEIPYGVAIYIEEMKYDSSKNLFSIIYNIIIEKESQKPIIIGQAGKAIKKLNIDVRTKLSEYYDCKIFTKNEVKVKKDWRNNDLKIKELGYKK